MVLLKPVQFQGPTPKKNKNNRFYQLSSSFLLVKCQQYVSWINYNVFLQTAKNTLRCLRSHLLMVFTPSSASLHPCFFSIPPVWVWLAPPFPFFWLPLATTIAGVFPHGFHHKAIVSPVMVKSPTLPSFVPPDLLRWGLPVSSPGDMSRLKGLFFWKMTPGHSLKR